MAETGQLYSVGFEFLLFFTPQEPRVVLYNNNQMYMMYT
jgi:hypothetical protein